MWRNTCFKDSKGQKLHAFLFVHKICPNFKYLKWRKLPSPNFSSTQYLLESKVSIQLIFFEYPKNKIKMLEDKNILFLSS